jgi:acyl-lipid omega-6 desaturase (Delta-12 desaturase)
LDKLAGGWYNLDERLQAKRLSSYCRNFASADDVIALRQLATTLVPLFILIATMFAVQSASLAATLILAVPASLLLVRVFALQHDCGHGSFFSARPANEVLGAVLSVMTVTPYDHWRRSHALHHAGSGNLDRRGFGDIATKTVAEYQAMNTMQRLRYRVYRHWLVTLVLGPPVFFIVLQRLALGSNMPMKHSWKGLLVHNLSLVAVYGSLSYAFGLMAVLTVMLPAIIFASWIGGFLFYVQHQFEETLWEGADEWDAKIAALKGSSHLVLPRVLDWFTCDIGLHHIHHLNSKIPNYRLRECLQGDAELQSIAPKLTLAEAFASARLGLWDETTRKLITFRASRALEPTLAILPRARAVAAKNNP